ncbi:tyrosine-type recombinase/integrase, partial [Armatimonas sp.]|uniref:tyrosine-type recombinase/integrase n=1 Tax=Armatimonas sp. TaxID=1872638 RepID=UPI00374C9250
ELIPKWEQLGCANTLGLVFTTWEGGPLEYQNVRRQCMLTLTRAGIEGVRLHDLRHLCASLLLARNIHPRIVMEILGHSQISLTMNTYSHVLPGVATVAATAMDELIRPRK